MVKSTTFAARRCWLVVVPLGLAMLYLAHSMALRYRIQPAVSLWFPPSGMAIALTLWFGPIGAVLTGIASVTMAPFWGSDGWYRLVGLTDVTEPLVAWFLYRRYFQAALTLRGLRNAIAFILSAPLAACVTSAIVGGGALVALGKLPAANLSETIVRWWVGNAIGTMAIAPSALLLLTPLLQSWKWISSDTDKQPEGEGPELIICPLSRSQWLEIVSILAISACSAWFTVLGTQKAAVTFEQFSLLSFIPIVWAATRFGVKGGMLTASFCVLVTLLDYLILYPNAISLPQFPVEAEILHTHKLSLLVQCAVGLLVGTAITERTASQVALAVERVRLTEYQTRAQLSEKLFQLNRLLTEANQQLQSSEERFRTSVENMLDCFGIYTAIRNEAGQIVDFRTEYVNEAAWICDRRPQEEQINQRLCELLPGHQESGLFNECCQVVETGQPLVKDARLYEDDYGQRRLVRAFDIRIAKFRDGFVATWRDVTERCQAEEELHRRQQEFAALVENSPDVISRLDRELRHVYVNPAMQKATGLEAQAFIGKTPTQLGASEELAQQWQANLQAVLRTGQAQVDQFSFPHPDGTVRFYQARIVPEFAQNGAVDSVLVVSRDITELKQAERDREELLAREQAANEILQLFVEHTPLAIAMFDRQMHYLHTSRCWVEQYGAGRTSLTGLSHYDVLSDMPDWWRQVYQRCLAGATERCEEDYFVRADGSASWLRWEVRPWYTSEGEIGGIILFVEDITNRKRIEEALQQSEAIAKARAEELETFMETVPAAVWIARDPECHQMSANRAAYKLTRSLPGSVLTATPADGKYPFEFRIQKNGQDIPLDQLPMQRAGRSGQDVEAEFEFVFSDDDVRSIYGKAVPLRDDSGAVRGAIGAFLDVTERKQIEEALRQKQEWLDLAQAAAKIGSFEWNIQTNVNVWSPELEALYSLEPGDFGGTYEEWARWVHPEDLAKAEADVISSLETGEFFTDWRVIWKDGSIHWLHARAKVFYDENGKPLRMVGINVDVTDRKQAEEALRQSEARLRRIVDSNIIGIFFGDLSGTITDANDAFLKMLGYTRQELPIRWDSLTPFEQIEHTQQAVVELWERGICTPLEKEFFRKDGSRVPILIGIARLMETERECVCFVLDLTERKRIETERAQLLVREQAARQQAEAASRMKDEFLAIVSHELRSPLNAILGWSRLLRTRKFDPEKTEQALASIERNAQAQTQLIEDLLDISRIIRGNIRLNLCPTSLIPIIQAALDTVRPTADTKSIQIESRLEPEVNLVSGDPDRLQQIVWNLLSNAVKFTPQGGQVEIRLERVDSQAQIQVIDTGKGISPDFLPYVFDRFRQADATTTRTQGGLGLGLAIVRNLVELHGGTVHVESRGEGQGAIFTVRLLLLPHRADESESENFCTYRQTSLETALNLDGLKILAVDDEADTREFLKTALEQYGAVVTTAASTRQALQLLQTVKPDVLLSDIGMPIEDGYTLIRRVRSLPPEQGGQIPAVALTAYAREGDRIQALSAGFQMHVPKPMEPVQLIAVVARLAGKRASGSVTGDLATNNNFPQVEPGN